MLEIHFDPDSAHITGPTQDDEFEVTSVNVFIEEPERDLPVVELPGVTVRPFLPAAGRLYNLLRLDGSAEGQFVQPLYTENYSAEFHARVQGNMTSDDGSTREDVVYTNAWIIRMIKPFVVSGYRNDDFLVGNRYNGKKLNVLMYSLYPMALPRDAGDHEPGSVSEASTRLMLELWDGVTPGSAAQDLYQDGGTYHNVDGPVATRNPYRVMPGLDFSGVSISRAEVGGVPGQPATLISPRHAICALHTQIHIGTNVWFHRSDGTMQKVVVVGRIDPGMDLTVLMFDQDVTGCEIYKALPNNWAEYLPGSTHDVLKGFAMGGATNGLLPVVTRMANTGVYPPGTKDLGCDNNPIDTLSPKIRVAWVFAIGAHDIAGIGKKGTLLHNGTLTYAGVPNHPLNKFWQTAYGGDSGSPWMMLVPDRSSRGFTPALLGTYYTAGNGSQLAEMHQEINDAMAAMSAAQGEARQFTLGSVDLSAYNKYTPVGA